MVTQLSTSIEEMDAVSLNYWLGKFMTEVAKKSVERYPQMTVYGIICGIRRYLVLLIIVTEGEVTIAIICSIKMYSSESYCSFHRLVQMFSLFRGTMDAEIKDAQVMVKV